MAKRFLLIIALGSALAVLGAGTANSLSVGAGGVTVSVPQLPGPVPNPLPDTNVQLPKVPNVGGGGSAGDAVGGITGGGSGSGGSSGSSSSSGGSTSGGSSAGAGDGATGGGKAGKGGKRSGGKGLFAKRKDKKQSRKD